MYAMILATGWAVSIVSAFLIGREAGIVTVNQRVRDTLAFVNDIIGTGGGTPYSDGALRVARAVKYGLKGKAVR